MKLRIVILALLALLAFALAFIAFLRPEWLAAIVGSANDFVDENNEPIGYWANALTVISTVVSAIFAVLAFLRAGQNRERGDVVVPEGAHVESIGESRRQRDLLNQVATRGVARLPDHYVDRPELLEPLRHALTAPGRGSTAD